MTEDDKRLLLKDICARLPYGVICHTEKGDGHLCSINQTIFGVDYVLNINPLKRDYFNDSETDEQAIKPYLRPMSSMTDEEREEVKKHMKREQIVNVAFYHATEETYDWYNSHHFDYRGLIEKGLALEAPADMYKIESE